MTNIEKEKLLQRKEVVEEINRHLWLESEKAGYDIGFQKAAEDWLTHFSTAWIKYHLPQHKAAEKKSFFGASVLKRGKAAKASQ